MNCHDIQQTLIDALYDDLSAQARHDIEAHRATCADCAKVWTSLQAMQQVLGQWADVSPPADLRARVLAHVAVQSREVTPPIWWRQGLAGTGLSVVAGLVMMVGRLCCYLGFWSSKTSHRGRCSSVVPYGVGPISAYFVLP